MPYIITTIPPGLIHAESDLTVADMPSHAVATLDEAREVADEVVIDVFDRTHPQRVAGDWMDYEYSFRDLAQTLPESGGTIGPLPDGTVIEVQRASWDDLDERGVLYSHGVRFPDDELVADEILADYNARS